MQIRYFPDDRASDKPQPFMEFIWAVNSIAPGEFDEPIINTDLDGNYAEVYINFIVRFPTKNTEIIEATTARGVMLMNRVSNRNFMNQIVRKR